MNPKVRERLKQVWRRLRWLPVLVLAFLLLLELFYRNQWIDTYRRELTALNPSLDTTAGKKRVLVMGDSFSAAPNSWVNLLRARHPELQFINSAVPGTTVLHANLMVEARLERFRPDLLIYQVYVGNDLFDLRYPLNWGQIGFFRNLYWGTANHLRGLAWLNYALGQFKRATGVPDFAQGKVEEGEFVPAQYSERERLYLQAEPGLIADAVLLQGDRATDMDDYVAEMQDFLAMAAGAHVPVLVVVVPHCAQVHPRYAARMAQLGATGMDMTQLQQPDFPYMKRLTANDTHAVRWVNLVPRLQEREAAGEAMYYLHDAHLSDAGQAALAGVVDELLGPILSRPRD